MMKIPISSYWKGYIVSNLCAIVLVAGSKYLIEVLGGHVGAFVFSQFIIIPFLMGILEAWYWKDLGFSTKKLVGLSCLNGLIAILCSYLFLGEGTICLLIVSPLLFGFIIAGVFSGKAIFRKNKRTLNVSMLSFLSLIFVADLFSPHHHQRLVSDQLIVKAPVEKVWKYVVSFKRIEQPNEYWLFRIGMPSPIEATVDAHRVGAGRKCIFSNGYVFDERIVTFDEHRNLTFDVVNQPRDPEIMGHIDILRGQFLLKDNGDGTTTLTGNSWYRLYVFPVWYYDRWAEKITRNVHWRVMEHIKQLSETE